MIKLINSRYYDRLLNKYFFTRFNHKNFKFSYSKKINIIDHYIWWFTNKRNFRIFKISQKKLIFFWYEKISLKKKTYWTCGFHLDDSSNLIELIKTYKIMIKYLKKKKNIPILGIINKKNFFLKKLNKDLGFLEINCLQNESALAIKKFYKKKDIKKYIFLKL